MPTWTRYTMADLKDLAKWTLKDTYCCEGQHKVTLASVELLLGEHPSLYIHGICKKHQYHIYTNCAI